MFNLAKHHIIAVFMALLALVIIVPDTASAQSLVLNNTDNVADNSTLMIMGASSATTAVVGGTTYLFVSGMNDDGVSVFSVDAGGQLLNVGNITDNSARMLAFAKSVTTAIINGTTYLFVAGFSDDGVSVFRVVNSGSFNVTTQANVTDNSILQLDGANSVATANISGTTYLFVAGTNDHGVSVFSVNAAGMLQNVFNVTDNSQFNLSGASSVTTANISGTTYLFVAGTNDSGVSVFSVNAAGQLQNVDNINNNAPPGAGLTVPLQLKGAVSVTTANIGGTTYLFVAGWVDDGVSVFSVNANGILQNVDNITHTATVKLDGADSVTTAVINGTTYLFVAIFDNIVDSGFSVFSVNSNGKLQYVTNVTDDPTLKFMGASSVATTNIGGTPYLFVTGYDEGVSVFSLKPSGGGTGGAVLLPGGPVGVFQPPLPNLCCTPWTERKLETSFVSVPGPNGLNDNFSLGYNDLATTNTQMQAYINYVNAVYPQAYSVRVSFILKDFGAASTVTTGGNVVPVATSGPPVSALNPSNPVEREWIVGGTGPVGPAFWMAPHQLQVNHWYQIQTTVSLRTNTGVKLGLLEAECLTQSRIYRVSTFGGRGINGGAILEISDGKSIIKTVPVRPRAQNTVPVETNRKLKGQKKIKNKVKNKLKNKFKKKFKKQKN